MCGYKHGQTPPESGLTDLKGEARRRLRPQQPYVAKISGAELFHEKCASHAFFAGGRQVEAGQHFICCGRKRRLRIRTDEASDLNGIMALHITLWRKQSQPSSTCTCNCEKRRGTGTWDTD